MAIDQATLLRRIDEGFGRTLYPGDEHIVRDCTDLESARIKDALKGRHWRDVSFETLTNLRFALPFLSAEGYRFYLPAFMAMSIVDFQRADVMPDEVVRSLTPPLPCDIDRLRQSATVRPELQPFEATEWDQLLATMESTYRSRGPAEATFAERVSGFDALRSNVIREFLEYVRDVHRDEFPEREPEIALKRHWRHPAPSRSASLGT